MSEGPIRRRLQEIRARHRKVLICPTCGNEMREEQSDDTRYRCYVCSNCGTKVKTPKELGHW